MTINRKPKYIAAHMLARLSKRQPRTKRPKNPGESRTRQLVAIRSGGVCERCGVRRADSVHHRINRSQGGPWTASNCVHLCGSGATLCHGYVGEHPAAAGEEGFHLNPSQDPATSPVRYAAAGWVLLTDEGSLTAVGAP